MLKPTVILVSTLCGVLAAKSAVAVWDYAEKPLAGSYLVYGGYPAQQEARAPTPGDAKVAFSVHGSAAKEMFTAIGTGRAEMAPPERTCTGHPEMRIRQRDALICRHTPKDGYWCTFGFDLSTGLSTWGIVGGRICGE